MAENIVISIAAKIAEYTVAPVGQWLCYSCHYNSNIENLKKQKEKLQDARERVQDSVDAALRNGEKIYADVSKWLTDVDGITELATTKLREIEEEAGTGSFNASCLNLKHRHQLSREAKKIVEDIVELHNNGNFKEVSKPALPLEEMDYNSNMENLKNQKEKLQYARERVQDSVDAALRNGEKIYPDVSKWLTDVDGITELATTKLREIEEEAGTGSSNAACLNSEHRHQLSREAKKIVENIAELHENGKFEKVSYRTPPSEGMVITTTNMDYMAMESRMTAVKGIMEALGNADIEKIGVWGMPGVGKSTLMKEIARKAREEKLFNEVVMTVVTNSPDVRRIQGEIADTLGLKFDQETEPGRASHLQRRLSKDKKILVILDDIWKAFDLHEIGIPSEGCKIVMTSRDRDVLISGMGTRKAIHELKILQKEESWNLFEKMVGDSFKDRPEVRAIATKIAEKCAGLPIALVTVSKALRNKSLGIWKDALVQLTRLAPEHDKKIWLPVYSCIQLSYEHLDGEEAVKSLFLLCTGQGYYISYRDLLRYGFGLGLFLNIYTLEEARNRLESLVSNLLDSCLLLQSPRSSEEFYMHDLVRDVATIIASKNHNMFVMRDDGGHKAWPDVDALNRCEALSIHGGEIHKHPNKMECPKLRFFHVNCKDSLNLKMPDIFFQGMDKLEVLSLRRMRLPSLFPPRNLQTLCLDRCELGDIHGIGELKNLVILSLAGSDISNLPTEIGLLTRLRLLDLCSCYELKVIPPNVLSSLVNLEELYMREIKVQWEVERPSNEGKNASLAELKKLSHLTTLEIDIPDVNNLPKDLFTEKFERYQICIGDIRAWETLFEERAFSRTLKLKVNVSFQLDFGIKMLLKRIEYLYLDGSNSTKSVLYELNGEDFQKLKHLHIQNNGDIKHILESGTSVVAFPILETFVLKNMISLVEICQGKLPLESFKNLKVLNVENCEKLRFIFSSSIARGLSLLEELNITSCNNMGAIFVKEEEDGIEDQGDMMLFGRLQTLVLKDLPKLVGFLSTKDSFMADCRETNSEDNHDLQLPLLHHDQVSFPNLQTLCMEGLPKIKHVWSCGQESKTVFAGLEQLKILEIIDCGVEEIVAVEGGGEAIAIRTLVFPQVTKLKFRNLPRLKWFYKGVHVLKWPMLKWMTIEECDKVEIFASGVVSFEKTVQDQRQYEMSIKEPLFSVDELSFPSLETLHIRNMDSLEIIFGKLEGQNGKESQVLISPGTGTEESGATTHFVSTVSLPSLQTLHMDGLPKIKYVWSCGQEPKTVISCLEQLQVLEIIDCGVEEIVAVEGGEAVAIRTLVFPQVTKMNFRNLWRLKWFCKGVYVSEWPMLEEMEIDGCHKVEIFASEVVSFEKAVEDQRQSEMSNIKQPLFLVDEHSFPSLETLEFWNMDSLEIIFGKLEGQNGKEPQVLISPALGTEESGATTQFASTGKLPLIYFKNLKVLKVENCQKLRFVSSSSIAKVLSLLEKLKIKRCNNMGAIVVAEDKDGIEDGDVILFHQLQTLVLEDLPELVSFFSTKSSFMTDCGQIITEGNHNLHMPLLPHQVSFPSLQTLHMNDLPKIKHIWSYDQEPQTMFRFPALQDIYVGKCESLTSLFPAWVLRCLEQLKKIVIEDCEVEEIVAVERGGEAVAIRTLVFPRVSTLELRNLKRLKWFCKGVHVSKWPMLKKMKIEGCEEVEIFASGVVSFEETIKERQSETSIKQPLFLVDEHSFPSLKTLLISHCEGLFHVFPTAILMRSLTYLRITDCCSLEIIFGKLEGQNGKEPQVLISPASGTEESGATTHFASTLSFPSLKTLYILSMDKLEIIWQDQVTASSFPNIQELRISDCDKLLHVFQSNLHTTRTLIQSLTSLHIKDCDSLETIFRNMEGQNGKESQVLIAPSFRLEESIAREEETTRHIEFPTLTEMSLVGLPKLKWILEGVHTNLECPSLKELKLGGFGRVINMIWASKFPRSSSSQENQLQTCVQQPIFEFDEATFPKLEILSLRFSRTICPSRFSDFPAGPSFPIIRLPTLLELKVRSSRWEEIFSHELVDREIRLRRLSLNHLPMLIHLWKEDGTQPCPLSHNLQFLSLSGCGKLKNLVPSSVSLHNLTYLLISSCHGLINLLTSSTAKTLVQLRRMTVTDCKRITEIVAMEDGEANVEITFKKLAYLELDGLPNLTHFCSRPYSFGFPSLTEVIVRCCPEMKTFCHGVLSTPELTAVYDDNSCDDDGWDDNWNSKWKDDLNTTTRCLWEESNQYDTQCLFRERVENSEEDEDHP